jgi:hypothetical protein
MPYQVSAQRPDPVLDIVVTDAATGVPRRMTVLSGVLAVAPAEQRGMRMYVRGQQPEGEQAGLYLTDLGPLPLEGEIAVSAEASLSQVVVNARIDNVEMVYGIGDVTAQLMPGQDGRDRWPLLTFTCYGQQPLGIRYRVTLLREP